MGKTILLLTKQDSWSQQAAEYALTLFGSNLKHISGKAIEKAPEALHSQHFQIIISFLSPWIVPAHTLEHSALSINFHPGSCDYPGIGCYNFALYEDARWFGPVCHHMLPKVDSGSVITETLFAVAPDERVETLKLRTMQAMMSQYHYILPLIAEDKPLPVHSRQWTRRPFTRKELNALCEVLPDMPDVEKNRRIRATTYPGYPGPYLLLPDGSKQPYPVPPGPALA
jgi:methionyl-tRNA formyltransferase